MNSLAWPQLFNAGGANTLLISDTSENKAAIKSNIKLLLSSKKQTLFGDPYYGTSLDQLLFEPYSTVLVDLISDEICTAIHTYIPQVLISRNDISISREERTLKVELHIHYAVDNTSDLFTINLTNNLEEG